MYGWQMHYYYVSNSFAIYIQENACTPLHPLLHILGPVKREHIKIMVHNVLFQLLHITSYDVTLQTSANFNIV